MKGGVDRPFEQVWDVRSLAQRLCVAGSLVCLYMGEYMCAPALNRPVRYKHGDSGLQTDTSPDRP